MARVLTHQSPLPIIHPRGILDFLNSPLIYVLSIVGRSGFNCTLGLNKILVKQILVWHFLNRGIATVATTKFIDPPDSLRVEASAAFCECVSDDRQVEFIVAGKLAYAFVACLREVAIGSPLNSVLEEKKKRLCVLISVVHLTYIIRIRSRLVPL